MPGFRFVPNVPSVPDAELVRDARSGDRTAFNAIVVRYQSLVCSVAYSAIGDFALSEDLAQQAFVAAWRQLGQLEDPAKLRSWLCGIIRHLAQNHRRSERRQPFHGSDPVEHAVDAVAPGQTPAEHAATSDENALVWRSLQSIPEIYREPLVLFYRDQQPTRQIAEALDLPDEVIRQRLTRGRKLLRDEVTGLIEGALRKTVPGPVFTTSVMAALPTIGATVEVGARSALAGKAAAAVKTMAAASSLSPWAVNIGLPGLNLFLGRRRRRTMESHMSEANLRRLRTYRRDSRLIAAGFILLLVALIAWAALTDAKFLSFAPLLNGLLVGLAVAVFLRGRKYLRERRVGSAGQPRPQPGAGPLAVSEYRSAFTMLGLPFVHVVRHRSGGTLAERQKPVTAWIAIAPLLDRGPAKAYGLIYAQGRFACASLSAGVVAVGGVPIGLASVGGFAVGAVVAGWCSLGWAALGREAVGVFAAGTTAARGLWAWAGQFAAGEASFAPHVGDTAAVGFFHHSLFFRASHLFPAAMIYGSIVASVFVLLRELYARSSRGALVRNR